MFAVIKTGGKQYRVAANDELTVERTGGEIGDIIEFAEVLMVGVGADATIGAPFVQGALVTAEVVEHGRARKVIAFKKRRRQNSKRTRVIRIAEILTEGKKPSKKAAAKTEAKSAPASETLFTAPQGAGDDLTVIKGIGPKAAEQLNEQGITTFAQIAAFTDADIAKIDEAMPFSAAQIEDWREQAKALAENN
jgi:large subunit ribosomal protein L21